MTDKTPPVEYAGLVRKLKAGEAGLFEVESIEDLMADAADAITALEARARTWADLAQRTVKRGREWQDYCEKIERDTDAAMAEEIQRLRRDLPKAKARIRELEAAVLAEREACARVVENMPIQIYKNFGTREQSCKPATFEDAAAAIRARTQNH